MVVVDVVDVVVEVVVAVVVEVIVEVDVDIVVEVVDGCISSSPDRHVVSKHSCFGHGTHINEFNLRAPLG